MNKNNIFESRRPLIAILRGITPLEAESVSDVLIEAGISIIEVPLNSPQPFETIERMVKFHGANGIFGAGTVLREYDVYRVQEVGGKIIVSPNLNTLVIKKTKELNLLPDQIVRAGCPPANATVLFVRSACQLTCVVAAIAQRWTWRVFL